MMIEIERKYRLTDEQYGAIQSQLRAKYGNVAATHQVDKVFLHGIDSFKNFVQGMPVMRLRRSGDMTSLTYKRAVNDAGDTVEHEVSIGSLSTMELMLTEMDYRLVTTVAKDRTEIKDGEMTIALDTVDGLGHFIEFEIIADNQASIASAETNITSLASTYGLSANMIERQKYDQLLAAIQ